MKKMLGILLALCLVLTTSTAFAEIKFDLTPFENDETFTVEFDEMDDTGTISNSCVVLPILDDDEGFLVGNIDIRIIENQPPVMRMTLCYVGEDWIFVDKCIIKTKEHRYTFEVDRDTEVSGGKIYEMFTIALTDQSISMIAEMINDGGEDIRIRLSGDRNVDGKMTILTKEGLEKLYNAYVASGALDNDFTLINVAYKCEIK